MAGSSSTTHLEPNPWLRSVVTEAKLQELVEEGLLRPISSVGPAEWLAPAPSDNVPRPPRGYVLSFMRYHRNRLGSPPSRFMRALPHRYGVELHHFSPDSILLAALFMALGEGYLGIEPHWGLFTHYYKAEVNISNVLIGGVAVQGSKRYVRAGSIILVPKRYTKYPRVSLSSSYTGWDAEWFYIHNDGDFFPPIIREKEWNWDTILELLSLADHGTSSAIMSGNKTKYGGQCAMSSK